MTRRGFGAVGLQPAGSVDDATASFVRRLLLSVLIGLGAAGALGFVLSRTLTRSVGETAAVARRLAAGERGVPVGESSVSEIADMGHAIAALDEALSASEGRQREFLLSVSHEIRTPLTALRGYAEALAEGAIDPGDIRATGEVLVTETERIDRFVADLLALARLEADDFDLEEAEVDVARVLDDLAAVWRASFERAGVSLEGPVDRRHRPDRSHAAAAAARRPGRERPPARSGRWIGRGAGPARRRRGRGGGRGRRAWSDVRRRGGRLRAWLAGGPSTRRIDRSAPGSASRSPGALPPA